MWSYIYIYIHIYYIYNFAFFSHQNWHELISPTFSHDDQVKENSSLVLMLSLAMFGGSTVEITGNLTKFIVLWSFNNLISVNKFYLVKCYMKHTANIWNSFFTYFYIVFPHISIFSTFLWKSQILYFMHLCPNWWHDELGPIYVRFKKFVKVIACRF